MCKTGYDTPEEATDCLESTPIAHVEVGDIVETRYGFGWYDGDRNWVINPDVDTSVHGFDKSCSMGFYYVVTGITTLQHEVIIHLATKAMTGSNGYRGGWTTLRGHYFPKKIDAPESVIEDSKDLIGQIFDNLL